MKARYLHKIKEADNIYTYWFLAEKPLDQIAGQFIEMTLEHPNPDERGIKHWFTISSSPTEAPNFSITTKFATGLESTFKQHLRQLQAGQEVTISDPMGDFVLPMNDKIPLVFIAGGIGITPFRSILKWLIDTKQERDLNFIYAVNNEHEIVFQDLFERYGMHRIIVPNKPVGEWDGPTGRLTGKRILELAEPANDALVYISGPEGMVESLNEQLQAAGIEKNRLVGDFFPGYLQI